MNHSAQPIDRTTGNQVLDEVVDEITRRLQAGEAVAVEDYTRDHPELAEPLGRLLPGMKMLADLGHASDATPSLSAPDANIPRAPEYGILGDFRIMREIGRGGMGVVYQAQQISLQRQVALKVLPFAAVMDPKQLKRFKNEASAAAGLHHPNIVPVYSVGCERSVHFYAMQYIEGATMADVVRQMRRLDGLEQDDSDHADDAGRREAESLLSASSAQGDRDPASVDRTVLLPGAAPPPPATETHRELQAAISTEQSSKSPAYFRSVAELAIQVAEALDYAHEEGVIHRDIKPSNLILDEHGKVWVTDFGLARVQSDPGLTMTGDILGTLRYMSPEQALAGRVAVDHRADIYSLGVTLYELLTLRPAFAGRDRQETLRQIAFEEPAHPCRWNRALPSDLETIVLKSFAKNPAERYATARELAEDLRCFLDDKPIRARRPSLAQRAAKWSRRHRPAIAGTILSLVMLVTVAGILLAANNLQMQKKNRELEETNLQLAAANERTQAEKERAEENLDKAREAVDRLFTRVASDLVGEPHMEKIRRALLEDAQEFYQSFLEQKGDDPAIRQETARAYLRVGKIRYELGAIAEADKTLRQGIEGLRALSREYPSNVSYRLDIADGLAHLGYLHTYLLASSNKGVPFRQQEVAVYEQLTNDYPDTPRYLELLASAQTSLGNALKPAGRWIEAEKYLRQSVATWGTLEERFPEHRRSIGRQAASYQWLGALLMQEYRTEEAEPLLRRALLVREKLVADHPSSPSLRSELALLYSRYGTLRQYQGKLDEAIKLYGQAIEVRQRLLDDFPSMVDHRRNLGDIYDSLSVVLSLSGKKQESLEALRKSLIHVEFWAEINPQSDRAVGKVHYRIGLALYDLRRESEASAEFLIAQKALQECIERTPEQYDALHHLAWLCATCPLHQFRDGKRAVELAKARIQHGTEYHRHWQGLAAAHLEAGNWSDVIVTLKQMPFEESRWDAFDWFFLAVAEWKLDHKEQARRAYQKGLAWMPQHPFTDRELPRFCDETATILEIKEAKDKP